jgi:hypothetical protein
MALVEINWRPPARQLRIFAVLLLAFAALVAWILHSRFAATQAGIAVVAVTTALAVLGILWPKTIWPVYVVWMAAVLPVGWVVSHVVMAVVFYLVVTPIGLIMRMCGHDPMEHRFDRQARTYWKKRPPPSETSRYFRQF